MLRTIIQQCYTGFGDCVVGYVSAYLFKKQLEKQYLHQEIQLLIDWRCVHCPYVRPNHLAQTHPRLHRSMRSIIGCLYSGVDGTLAFAQYYRSPRMIHDLQRKTHLILVINQYIGKCLIDTKTSREEIKQLTYEAYQFFWNQVLDPSIIQLDLSHLVFDATQLTTIYIRLGDQYLCQHDPQTREPLRNLYQHLIQVPVLTTSIVSLIGDVPTDQMTTVFQDMFPGTSQLTFEGPITHSCGELQHADWIKIFTDLMLLLKAQEVIILTNNSNFVRIVLFLKDSNQTIYFRGEDGHVQLIEDTSQLFAKHYHF